MGKRRYDQDRCDTLKRDRKNLTNKYYRRQVKLRSDPSDLSAKKDSQKISQQIDSLNSEIWYCSKQYYDLQKKKTSASRKLNYREKKIKSLEKTEPAKASQFKSQIRELKSEKSRLSDRMLLGTRTYSLRSNKLRVNKSIESLKRKYLAQKKRSENGIINPRTGKVYGFNESDRMKIIDQIKILEEKQSALEEVLVDYQRVKQSELEESQVDAEKQTEYSELTIYFYAEEFRRALEQSTPKRVTISGELIGTQSFNNPSDIISIMNAQANADLTYAEFASKSYVAMFVDNLNKELSLTFILMPEVDLDAENENE